jgi:hypothetical protein
MNIKIDKNNHIQLSIISIAISFILCVVIFLLSKPMCIQQVNRKTGTSSIYYPLLILYSALFSFVVGIIVFLTIMKSSEQSQDAKKSQFTYG